MNITLVPVIFSQNLSSMDFENKKSYLIDDYNNLSQTEKNQLKKQEQQYSNNNEMNEADKFFNESNMKNKVTSNSINNFFATSESSTDLLIGKNISKDTLLLELEAQDIIYSLDSAKLFTLTIRNISDERFTINLSDDYIHNVFFDVYDDLNLPVNIPPDLMLKRSNGYVSYRSITLYPTEFFTLTIDLNNFADFTEPGVYNLSARFYPEKYVDISQKQFYQSKLQTYSESNDILISVVDIDTLQEKIDSVANSNYTDIYRNSNLITREYGPYDVVQAALTGLQNKQWSLFFSYVDITDLFINSVSTSETFKLLTNKEQQIEINHFISRIENGNEDTDIFPPDMFNINETRFTTNNANVTVSVRLFRDYIIQLYRYNFMLKKKKEGWKIVDYTVKYVGIESKDLQSEFIGNSTDYISPTQFSR